MVEVGALAAFAIPNHKTRQADSIGKAVPYLTKDERQDFFYARVSRLHLHFKSV